MEKLTPGNVELVDWSQVVVGDVLVAFTPTGKDIVIPPTQRQLDRLTWAGADPRRIFTVPSVTSPRAGILEFGTGPDRWTGMETAKTWRVKH
jgi:hypothetical protein